MLTKFTANAAWSVRTGIVLGVALVLGVASVAPAAAQNGSADGLRQCVANLQASGRGFATGDLESLGITEYDVMVGRCQSQMNRAYGSWAAAPATVPARRHGRR